MHNNGAWYLRINEPVDSIVALWHWLWMGKQPTQGRLSYKPIHMQPLIASKVQQKQMNWMNSAFPPGSLSVQVRQDLQHCSTTYAMPMNLTSVLQPKNFTTKETDQLFNSYGRTWANKRAMPVEMCEWWKNYDHSYSQSTVALDSFTSWEAHLAGCTPSGDIFVIHSLMGANAAGRRTRNAATCHKSAQPWRGHLKILMPCFENIA